MDKLRPLTIDDAPDGSRQPMRDLQATVGFVPNLISAQTSATAFQSRMIPHPRYSRRGETTC